MQQLGIEEEEGERSSYEEHSFTSAAEASKKYRLFCISNMLKRRENGHEWERAYTRRFLRAEHTDGEKSSPSLKYVPLKSRPFDRIDPFDLKNENFPTIGLATPGENLPTRWTRSMSRCAKERDRCWLE